ncbi:PREDICTED: uncharacterized protein LOC109343534 isoform X1 [Lupinus angustifolius]|uniref:uncharacterized protein LOC109343534 isoform X1 n=1 Tax=Lupinus angustifolius TaxID=3871 RepID=UPI00092EC382|nr:PREDICTED: uncharacterized protein LOC109343534 isoform X1 [Lupinus angustifolius]
MADGNGNKINNLPDDLFSSKSSDSHSNLKDEALGGHAGEKGITVGLLDDSKDQVLSDNNIPLSPQWLYSKTVDAKTPTIPAGLNSTDPSLKESWRLEGSQDKKDWRRIAPDVDINRRWREEERETSLLGRRDRRKDDRRLEITSTSENRSSPSDRWHDSRGSGHDPRRENKWSSRWGPEDKEKDSRSEKKNDVEKEDGLAEKQSSSVGNRAGSDRDPDSRDKWRPRHRLETQAAGVATYRAAPGFGLEKGRAEGSVVQFSAGRGKANINGNLQIGRPPLGSSVGSVLVDKNNTILGKSSLGVSPYYYPRGKLLDIYRRQKVDPTFESMPSGMEYTSPITQHGSIEPLAFVAPAGEEETILKDILKGKITSSEVLGYSFSEDISGIGVILGEGKKPLTGNGRKVISGIDTSNDSDQNFIGSASSAGGSLQNIVEDVATFQEGKQKHMPAIDIHGRDESSGSSTADIIFHRNKVADSETFDSYPGQVSAFQGHANQDHIESIAASEISSNLPDDSHSLFDFSTLQHAPSINQQDLQINENAYPFQSVTTPEELSLCYLDPQGAIQGPFLGIDIILWFEQGFFGIDLPVRLSDAPEGSSFQQLGDMMPHLKVKSRLDSGSNLTTLSEPSDTIGRNLKVDVNSFDYNGYSASDDQPWSSSRPDATSCIGIQSQIPNQGYHSESKFSDEQYFNNIVAQDEDIVLSKLAQSSNGSPLMRPVDVNASYSLPTGIPVANEVAGSDTHSSEADKLHPFGLLMSELRDGSHLRRAQSSNSSLRLGDQGHFLDPLVDRDSPFADQGSHGGMVNQPSFRETWPDEHGINRHLNPDVHVGSLEDRFLSHMGPKFSNFDVSEHLMLQKLQKEQFQQQSGISSNHIPAHLAGTDLERFSGFSLSQSKNSNVQKMIQNPRSDYERLLERQIQQRQLELQQQQDMHHQQLLQQQMNLHPHQQSQVQQLLLEQLMNQHNSDPNFWLSKHDISRDNLFDQGQLRGYLHDLQQNSHSLRQHDPSMEQIIKANMGLNAIQERQADLSALLLQARHGNILSSEQQLHFQQDQLKAQQMSMALRQQLGLDGERHFGRSWSINETGNLVRNPTTHHHLGHSAGFNVSDIHKQQQRLVPQEEQMNFLGRNLPEQNHRGFFDSNSMLFDRSAPVSFQGRQLQEHHRNVHPTDQLGSLSSHHVQSSGDLFGHHPDTFKNSLPGNNGHVENSWIDPRVQLQHFEALRQRRVLGNTSADLSMTAFAGSHEESSTQDFMDLHQKLGLQSTLPSAVDKWHPLSTRTHDKSRQVSEASSLTHPFELPPDQVHMNDPFLERTQSANSSTLMHDHFASMHINEQYNNLCIGIQSQIPNQGYHSESKFSDEQYFNNIVAQDEDIVLSKLAQSSNGSPLMRPVDVNASYSLPTGIPVANEVAGSDTHSSEADKLHPFGLLMSELRDGSHLRRAQSSNSSLRLGDQGHFLDPLVDRDSPFADQGSHGGMVNQPSFRETWPDEHGINRHLNPDVHVGSLEDRFLSHMGPKFSNFDVSEHLMLQKLQKEQFQQQSGISSNHIPAHLAGTDLERFSGFSLSQSKNSNVQKMIQNPRSDYERLLERQIQQRQLELQQQQDMHHQQLLQQQMNLHPHQQSQVQQLLLEQLMNQHNSDPNFWLSKHDISRDNLFDQGQLRGYLHDLQQNSHSLRQHDPSMEQIIKANMGLNAIQERQADLSALLLQARHGNILSSEQQLHFQQDQLKAQQMSMALRQQLGLDGERHFGRSWSINETGNLVRNPTTHHHLGHSAGFNVSDIHKQQQRLVPQEEQMNFLGRNLPEQNHRGFFDSNSMLFDRSAPVSFQGRQLQEHHRNVHPTDQLGSLSSHHVQSSGDLFGHHPDTFKNSLPGNNGHVENSWIDPRVQLQHFEALRQRRVLGNTSADLSMTAFAGSHEESSTQDFMDLHQKLGLQSTLPSAVDKWHPLSTRTHDKSRQVSEASSLTHPFELPPDQVHMNDPFLERTQSANSSTLMHDHFASMHINEQYNNLGNAERIPLRSRSGALVEGQSLLSSNQDTLHPNYRIPPLTGKSAMEELLELEISKSHRHEFLGTITKSVPGVSELPEQVESTMNSMELPASISHSRHSSLSSAGGDGGSFGREMGLNNSRADEVSNDRVPPSSKGFDNVFHKRSHVSRTDQPSTHANQNNLMNLACSEGRREPSGNSSSTASMTEAQASGKKDVRFRTSSFGEGATSETSFIDMLRKPVLPEVDAHAVSGATNESSDGGQAGRSGKKKGKKGKQIDPSLLGFKVSSNRIMMGEIQRPEDDS